MFKPSACFKGAVFVWALSTMWFHGNPVAGLVMAAIPFGFGVAGLLERWRG